MFDRTLKGNPSQCFPTQFDILICSHFVCHSTHQFDDKSSKKPVRSEDPTCHLSQRDIGHHIELFEERFDLSCRPRCRLVPSQGHSTKGPPLQIMSSATLATLATPAMTMLGAHESDSSSDEATPLLHPAVRSSRRTPLPIRQLLVLACIRLAEPINFTIIFPFINEVLPLEASYTPGFNNALDDRAYENNRQAVRDRILFWLGGMHMSCR